MTTLTATEPAMAPTTERASDHLDRFAHPTYLVRRKVLKLVGGAFHIFDPAGNVVLYSKMKAFKLKEDIRLYTDEDMQTEVLTIQARQILDISAAYDVMDPVSGDTVGSLRRKGMKSTFLRDEWTICGPDEAQIGSIKEDSTLKALARRFVDFVALLLPQQYHVEVGGQTVCQFSQNFNPFVYKLNVDFTSDPDMKLDRRLGLAAAVLMAAIEGKQN